jgi:NDP-hexose-3-ketoreductase
MCKIRIGVMGCSEFAWRAMIPAMEASGCMELVAVASRTMKKATQFAQRFKCDAIVGYDELIMRDDIEAVYMPLPTGLHEEWVMRALELGKHILVEKSFAENYQSAKLMIDLARKKNLLVMENFLFPHHSQYVWAQEQLANNEIGEFKMLRSSFGFPLLPKDNFRYQRHLGGGSLLDAGAYLVKVSQLFLGSDLTLVGSVLIYDDNMGIDTSGHAMFKNIRQQIAQVSFGFGYYYQCLLELLGSKGKIVLARIFTAPPGFQPRAYLEYQDRTIAFSLPADNQYVNMCCFFANTTRNDALFQTYWNDLLNQAKLMDVIRRENKICNPKFM